MTSLTIYIAFSYIAMIGFCASAYEGGRGASGWSLATLVILAPLVFPFMLGVYCENDGI